MKEWEKHLVRVGEKLKSANILFENAKSLAKADYDIYYEPLEEEAESVIEDAEKFLERIKEAVREIVKK